LKKIFTVVLILIFLSGCQTSTDKEELRIAEQYGVAYAPLQIMQDLGYLEKYLPDVEISWVQLGNTAAIREAMVAGNLDIGFMAIPPFLIGYDNGMNWKIISGLSELPVGLVTYRDDINSIADFSADDRIALPQPGSVQDILLAMASKKVFNDASKFNNQLVTMSHPDAYNALLTQSEVTAHFTSDPYLTQELSQTGFHEILSGKEAIGGEYTFIIGAASESLYANENLYEGFKTALIAAITYINDNPQEASELLAANYDLSVDETYSLITNGKYTTDVKGLAEFMEFMYDEDYISQTYIEKDLFWQD